MTHDLTPEQALQRAIDEVRKSEAAEVKRAGASPSTTVDPGPAAMRGLAYGRIAAELREEAIRAPQPHYSEVPTFVWCSRHGAFHATPTTDQGCDPSTWQVPYVRDDAGSPPPEPATQHVFHDTRMKQCPAGGIVADDALLDHLRQCRQGEARHPALFTLAVTPRA